jgi:hypothetical protein
MHGCRIVISALLERSQARGRLQADAWARQIARASGRLASAPDEPTLRERLAELLPALGIRLCLAFRFIDSEAKSVELSCGWAAESARDALLRDHPKAAARDIVPEQLISREQATRLIVLPLADESKTFGYVVFDAAPVPGYTFEVLRELLTGAMLHLVES